jgi:hypothetical protein
MALEESLAAMSPMEKAKLRIELRAAYNLSPPSQPVAYVN